jgi:hypothetical protein
MEQDRASLRALAPHEEREIHVTNPLNVEELASSHNTRLPSALDGSTDSARDGIVVGFADATKGL